MFLALSATSLQALPVAEEFNYVTNGSFEEYLELPTGYNQLDLAKEWSSFTNANNSGTGPADYYIESVAYQFDGAIPAHLLPIPDGDAFVGTITTLDRIEFLGQYLKKPLPSDSAFLLTMYVAPWTEFIDGGRQFAEDFTADIALYGLLNIDAAPTTALVETTVDIEGEQGVLLLGKVNHTATVAGGWEKVSLEFRTAEEEIDFISIGLKRSALQIPEGYYGAFLAFDDVNIVRLAEPENTVRTGSGSMGIAFLFALVTAFSYKQLTKKGRKIYRESL